METKTKAEFDRRCKDVLDRIEGVLQVWQDDPEAVEELRQRVEALFDEEGPMLSTGAWNRWTGDGAEWGRTGD